MPAKELLVLSWKQFTHLTVDGIVEPHYINSATSLQNPRQGRLMAVYVLTPARRAALEKHNRNRLAGAGKSETEADSERLPQSFAAGVAAYSVHSAIHSEERINERIIKRHVELAEFHHRQLNRLRAHADPTSALSNPDFDPDVARREAIAILNRRAKRKRELETVSSFVALAYGISGGWLRIQLSMMASCSGIDIAKLRLPPPNRSETIRTCPPSNL